MSTSTTADAGVRLESARHGQIRPGEIAIGVIIGRMSEFFDFFTYAIASVVVFPKYVFSFLPPLEATLASFAVFALAFIARPIGTLIFTQIDLAFGRGAKLTAALFLLGTSTVALAFLPSYAEVGVVSVWMLAALRFGQGLAFGGTWDGLASLLALNAPQEKRGWYAMIPQLGAPFGLIVASGLFAYLVGHLSSEDFFEWGWRYPFFVAFAVNVVALFARLRIVVTQEFANLFQVRELRPTSVVETLREDGRTVVTGAFAPLASFALFHMVTVFPMSWIFLFTKESPAEFLLIEAAGAAVCVLAIAGSGYVADRVGRRTLLGSSAIVIAVFSGFAPQMLDRGPVGEAMFMFTGFILLGLSFGQASGAVASNFSRVYRYTGSALTSDLAWLFGAGFAPILALWLSSQFGLLSAGAYLLSGAACTLAALWLSQKAGSDDPIEGGA